MNRVIPEFESAAENCVAYAEELPRRRKRVDPHRPSAIVPAEYRFVEFEYLGDKCWEANAWRREKIRAHMARTGGTYSRHEHGGNCAICGSVNAIYTALFYHEPTNSYVRTGLECTDKLDASVDGAAFRKEGKAAREQARGKAKARATLEDAGLATAWAIHERIEGLLRAQRGAEVTRDEMTLNDLVSKLVKYGSISDRATSFLRTIVDRIARAPEIEAARAAEREAAAPVPTGRVEVVGTIVSFKEGMFGMRMVVLAEAGWKVFGAVPAALADVERGAKVSFFAAVEASRDDPKFGFFKRPTKARVI